MREEHPRWDVSFTPKPKDNGWNCSGSVALSYGERVVKEDTVGFHWEGDEDTGHWEPDASRAAYYRAMATSFNRNAWEPSTDHAVMAAARILQDALDGLNGRKVAQAREYRGGYSVTVHPGCIYRLDHDFRPISYVSPETRIDLVFTTAEQDAFMKLVQTFRLSALDFGTQTKVHEKGDGRKDKLTQREQKIAAAQAKLDAWNTGKEKS